MRIFLAVIASSLALFSTQAYAQSAREVRESYEEGPVWHMIYMRTAPGHREAYLKSLSGVWRDQVELAEKMGFVVDHHVLTKWPSDPSDWDVLIIEIFPNMAAYDTFWEDWAKVDAKILEDEERQKEIQAAVVAERTMLGVQIAREVTFKD